MTSLLGARKRVEEFAAAIDTADGTTPSPATSPELTELVELVGTLRQQPLPEPRPDFSASLRERLVAEAAELVAQDATLALPPRRHGARERRLALLASSFVLVGGSAGMAVAAQEALPGDALYPIKRGLENAETGLARGDASKGHDYLSQADSRLAEVRGLVGTGDENRVPATIEDFTAQAATGTDLVLRSFEESQDPDEVASLREFAAGSLDTLREVAKTADPAYQDDLAAAAAALLEIDERASAACPSCAEAGEALRMPALFLAADEANRALEATKSAKMENNHPPLPQERDAGGKGSTDEGTADEGSTGGSEPEGSGEGSGDGSGDKGTLPGKDGSTGGKVTGKVEEGAGDLLGTVEGVGKAVLPKELDPLIDTLLP